MQYFITSIILAIDASLLMIFSSNKYTIVAYIIFNIFFLAVYTMKNPIKNNIILIFLMLTMYVLSIEIMIHYMHIKIFLGARYLFVVPVVVTFIRILPKIKSCKLGLYFGIVLIINFTTTICYNKINATLYIKSVTNYIVAIMMYYILKNNDYDGKLIYKYIYIISFFMTLIQTIIGFNNDTRNGLFGVFGLDAYSIFLVIYPAYMFAKWLNKEKKIIDFIISLILTFIMLICIENKMIMVALAILLLGVLIIMGKVSSKHMFIFGILILLIPISYKALITFYPKFAFLNSIDAVKNYFFGNNNWNFQYGRFESLKIIFKDVDFSNKICGSGIGVSTPMDRIFYSELGINDVIPYYVKRYGVNHGFILTSLSTTLLDGGYILLTSIIFFVVINVVKTCKHVNKCNNDDLVSAVIIFISGGVALYYYVYSTLLTSYKTLIMAFIVMSITAKDIRDLRKKEENKK